MKRVLCSLVLGGTLLVAAPTAAFAHDGGYEHHNHHNYSCWSHRWGHEHHFEHHFGHGWKCDKW